VERGKGERRQGILRESFNSTCLGNIWSKKGRGRGGGWSISKKKYPTLAAAKNVFGIGSRTEEISEMARGERTWCASGGEEGEKRNYGKNLSLQRSPGKKALSEDPSSPMREGGRKGRYQWLRRSLPRLLEKRMDQKLCGSGREKKKEKREWVQTAVTKQGRGATVFHDLGKIYRKSPA